MDERRFDSEKRERFELLRADVMRRLRRVCAHWPAHDFESLAAQITRLRLKYETSTAVPRGNDARLA